MRRRERGREGSGGEGGKERRGKGREGKGRERTTLRAPSQIPPYATATGKHCQVISYPHNTA